MLKPLQNLNFLSKRCFVERFTQAFVAACTPVNVLSGFHKTGLHPLNPSAVAKWLWRSDEEEITVSVVPVLPGFWCNILIPPPPTTQPVLLKGLAPAPPKTKKHVILVTLPDSVPTQFDDEEFAKGTQTQDALLKISQSKTPLQRVRADGGLLTQEEFLKELPEASKKQKRSKPSKNPAETTAATITRTQKGNPKRKKSRIQAGEGQQDKPAQQNCHQQPASNNVEWRPFCQARRCELSSVHFFCCIFYHIRCIFLCHRLSRTAKNKCTCGRPRSSAWGAFCRACSGFYHHGCSSLDEQLHRPGIEAGSNWLCQECLNLWAAMGGASSSLGFV